jgi:hypothetical protein
MGRTASTEPQCLYKVALFTLHPLTQSTPHAAAGRDPTGPHTVANGGKRNTREKINSYKLVQKKLAAVCWCYYWSMVCVVNQYNIEIEQFKIFNF